MSPKDVHCDDPILAAAGKKKNQNGSSRPVNKHAAARKHRTRDKELSLETRGREGTAESFRNIFLFATKTFLPYGWGSQASLLSNSRATPFTPPTALDRNIAEPIEHNKQKRTDRYQGRGGGALAFSDASSAPARGSKATRVKHETSPSPITHNPSTM